MTELRDLSNEYRINFLKYLDSILSNDNNVICIWGCDDNVGLTIVEKEVVDTNVDTTLITTLDVKFYVNKEGKLILVTVK